jgi:hypothetical protein
VELEIWVEGAGISSGGAGFSFSGMVVLVLGGVLLLIISEVGFCSSSSRNTLGHKVHALRAEM